MMPFSGYMLIGLAVTLGMGSAQAQERLDPGSEIKPFAAEVAREHGVDERRVEEILANAKVLGKVLKAMSRPAEGKEWREYRPIFLTEKRIAKGLEFWKKHRDILKEAREKFGVAEEMIVSIIGVETYYASGQATFVFWMRWRPWGFVSRGGPRSFAANSATTWSCRRARTSMF